MKLTLSSPTTSTSIGSSVLDSSVAFPVGSQINLLQTNTGQVTVAGAGGVTVNGTPGLKFRAQWSGASLIKRDTNTWVLVGDVSV